MIWRISGWWFQPLWKNIGQIGNLPQIEVNIKNVWNHHLVEDLFFGTPSVPIFLKGRTALFLGLHFWGCYFVKSLVNKKGVMLSLKDTCWNKAWQHGKNAKKKIHHILFQDNLTCFAAKIQRGNHVEITVWPLHPPVGEDDTKDLLMVQRGI